MTKREIKALILDMDGVLWRAYEPIVDLELAFKKINALGLQYAFATNNSTKHISTYLEKLTSLKIPISKGQILSSSIATAQYLKRKFPEGGNVFILGEAGMIETFKDHGFFHSEENAIAVVVGLYIELDYKKLAVGATLIRNGAEFIGTNGDTTFPMPQGFAPGAGSLLAFMEAASGVSPKVIGKPKTTMFNQALDYLEVDAGETLMIGDRLDSDILGGQNAGLQTALMLSGVTSMEEGENWEPRPDYIAENLLELVKILENE